MRRLALPLVTLLAFNLPAKAELTKHKDWDTSPEFVYLATDDEKKAWKAATTDEEAERQIAFFWARRDPDLKTPQNEFRDRFEALAAKADEVFKMGNKRGALTERGKALLLIGPPKSMGQIVQSTGAPQTSEEGGFGGGGGRVVTQVFKYEAGQLAELGEPKALELKFEVDPSSQRETLRDSKATRKLESKAVQLAIKNPDLKELPVYKTREQIEAEQRAAQEAAMEAAKGAPLTPAVREQLEALFAKDPHGPLTLFPLAFRDAAVRLQLQVLVPASAVAAPEAAKLAILVKSKDGKDAARREEPAALAKVKGDLYTDRGLPVAPGDYDVAVVVLDGQGAVLASARRPVTVHPLSSEFSASGLFLAETDFAIEGSQPGDPFVFSARKFVARPDSKLDKTDGLSYVVRIYNPAIDPTTRMISLKRVIKIKPKTGAAIDVPLPADEPVPVPEAKEENQVQVLDLAGAIVDANLGDYFRPGDYTIRMTVTDAVANKTIEISAPFTIVAPPADAKPAAAAPKKKG